MGETSKFVQFDQITAITKEDVTFMRQFAIGSMLVGVVVAIAAPICIGALYMEFLRVNTFIHDQSQLCQAKSFTLWKEVHQIALNRNYPSMLPNVAIRVKRKSQSSESSYSNSTRRDEPVIDDDGVDTDAKSDVISGARSDGIRRQYPNPVYPASPLSSLYSLEPSVTYYYSCCLSCYQGAPGHAGYPGKPGADGKDGYDGRPGLPSKGYAQAPAIAPGEYGQKIPDYSKKICVPYCQQAQPGLPGRPGYKGKPGPPGNPGHPATQYGKLLVGPPGPPGLDGPPGRPGPPGKKGEHGDPGSVYIEEGPPGSVGPIGRPGPPGLSGRPGEAGPPGPLGYSTIGDSGPPGAPGRPGPDGDSGPPGRPGPDGNCNSCPVPRTAPGY